MGEGFCKIKMLKSWDTWLNVIVVSLSLAVAILTI